MRGPCGLISSGPPSPPPFRKRYAFGPARGLYEAPKKIQPPPITTSTAPNHIRTNTGFPSTERPRRRYLDSQKRQSAWPKFHPSKATTLPVELDPFNVRIVREDGAGPVADGDVVAIGIDDGGYLKDQSRDYGINLVWSDSPVFEWQVRSVVPHTVPAPSPANKRGALASFMIGFQERAHALAIAAFVSERGAAYSGEILGHFYICESTLRRRRPLLKKLGIEFVENGRGSFYVTASLLEQFPTTYRALGLKTAAKQAKDGS
jgi:hypothetical protein